MPGTLWLPRASGRLPRTTGKFFSEKRYPNEHDTCPSQGKARRPCARDRRVALQSRDRLPLLGGGRPGEKSAPQAKLRPAQGREGLRRPEEVRPLRGRMAARRAGAPLGAQGPVGQADCTSSRRAAPPASPRAASSSTTSASTTRCSATRCRTSTFPRGATG